MVEAIAAITAEGGVFRLSTATTGYWFRVTPAGHLEHLYYGRLLPDAQDPAALAVKRTAEIGTSVVYPGADPLYSLDHLPLEWSGSGRGDYRVSPAEIVMPDGSFATDFVYDAHTVTPGAVPGAVPGDGLPSADAGDDPGVATLRVDLVDRATGVRLALYYTVFPATDVIARRAVLANGNPRSLTLRRLLSFSLDLPNRGFRLLTLNGAWIREAHLQDQPVGYGQHITSSTTGASSHRHNPGFVLAEAGATEEAGHVFGFNLVYSGNHMSAVERSADDLVRVTAGINPDGFEWTLGEGEVFATPQAVLTYSAEGLGGVSAHFHDFTNRHIVPPAWRGRERPILYNNWEATFFRFTAKKLIGLAKQAKALGVELFVLDDGWFGRRDSDTAGLGDYTVNRKKFPQGLPAFADAIRGLGLQFGIWVEPEMVNPDSDLYRAHPDWAVTTPGRAPLLSRNQLVLDLTRPEVRDYLVDNVGRTIDDTRAAYVKWDFNRYLSDAFSPGLAHSGEFFHRYVLGLYDVLGRVFGPRPDVLLESCASGGNRFDLGMLCFSPQVWASDDTDPVERLKIQAGLTLLYPPSAIGAHVSDAPHQQTLRDTPLTTRFNVAAFGNLGYELDVSLLSPVQRQEIAAQIEFYKAHRATLQFGRFRRADRGAAAKPNKAVWVTLAADGREAIAGLFQTLATAAEGLDLLALPGLDPAARYTLATRPQPLFVARFGGLVKHILPVALNPDGAILGAVGRRYRLTDAVETYSVTGGLLADGVPLAHQFMGSAYNDRTRLLGDFGSSLYTVTRED